MGPIQSPGPTSGSREPCEGQLSSLPQAKMPPAETVPFLAAPGLLLLPTLASCASHSCLPCTGEAAFHFLVFSLTSDLTPVAYVHLLVPGQRLGTPCSP